MSVGDLFKLAKLTIKGFKEPARSDPPVGTFEVQYNPESLSLKHESVYQRYPSPTRTSGKQGWTHSKPKRLAVNLILDGTKVGYMGVELLSPVRSVADQVNEFLAVCYDINGPTHQPLFLKLIWDKGVLGPSFDCRLESVDVKYTAFERDGSPLHAELAAVFVEELDPKKKANKESVTSPDLTHRRLVVAGDTLPQLCREIYGSPAHYLRIAQLNGLDDFRNLTPGIELIFPPFERPRNRS